MKKIIIILGIVMIGFLLLNQNVVDTTAKKKPITREQKYKALKKDLGEQKIQMKKLNDTIK